MRQTNNNIIAELLPQLKKKVKQYNTGDKTVARLVGNRYCISVCKSLHRGRYDRAELQTWGDRAMEEGGFYSKEYTGCGNGFYALVSWDGKIIHSEWD